MKHEKPYIAKLDEVTITRDSDTAYINYKKENVGGVNFKIGNEINQMSDQDILDLHNEVIKSQIELARNYRHVAIEIPYGKPQTKYSEKSGCWTARGDVLRCHIGYDSRSEMATILIDDQEFTMEEFGHLLSTYEGWGMRLVIVPEDETHITPPIKIKDPDEEDSEGAMSLHEDFLSKSEH